MTGYPCGRRYSMYPKDTICVGAILDTERTIGRMAEWYERVRERMLSVEPPVTQADLMPVFGVTTRGAVGHYLSGRREPSLEVMVKLADRLGMTLDELLRGSGGAARSTSQDSGWDLPMLSEALVSLDKAIRKRGLVWDAAYVAPALRLAYLERLKHPATLDRAGYAAYDRAVAKQLEVQQSEYEPEDRRIEAAGARRASKAPAARAKAGHRSR